MSQISVHSLNNNASGMTHSQPHPIRKAVFPVAGPGTRFLSAAKVMVKERLADLRNLHERDRVPRCHGPRGRLNYFKFARTIPAEEPIDTYNHGEMWRDFTYTYVTDLVRGIRLLIDAVPGGPKTAVEGDNQSPAASFRVVNIGNFDKMRLLDFIDAIEAELGQKARRNYLPMQTGDVRPPPGPTRHCSKPHRLHPADPVPRGAEVVCLGYYAASSTSHV